MSAQSSRAASHRSPAASGASRPQPSAHVALLDRDGVVVSVNRAWRQFGLANGGSATTGLGTNYLAVCEHAAEQGEPAAAKVARLVRAALDGVDNGERIEYRCGLGKNLRCFSVYAVPLPGRHRGALVVHVDISLDTTVEMQTSTDDA